MAAASAINFEYLEIQLRSMPATIYLSEALRGRRYRVWLLSAAAG